MAQAALDLLKRWMAETIRAVPEADIESEATRLAGEFTAYARDAGLSAADLAELEEDMAATLENRMEEALKAASEADGDSSTPA